MLDRVTQSQLNTVINNITKNLIGTANNLQENQMRLQKQILDLNKKDILLGTFYYRLYDPNVDMKNYASKSTIQYQNQDETIIEKNYESYRFGQHELNGTNDITLLIKITGSNTYTSSSSTIRLDSNIKRFDTETVEIIDNEDIVIGKVIYDTGILENTDTITNVQSLRFVVLGGTGKYRDASFMIIEYYNDSIYDSTNKNLYARKISIYS